MTIKVREWKKGKRVGFEVDIRFTYPDGTPFRRRIKAPVESKSAAKRWGEAKERALLIRPSPVSLRRREEERKEVPTLNEFGPRYIDGYARANKHKASGVHSKERILALHLDPQLGKKRLDRVTEEDVQLLKASLSHRTAKTINNVLHVLSGLLRTACRWKVIDRMPCSIELMKTVKPVPSFYEFSEYERLVRASAQLDLRTAVMVLLGGDAGLRRGEMLGLRWSDVDFTRRQLVVTQAVWEGKGQADRTTTGRRRYTDTPKGGRGRVVPLTEVLCDALRQFRHLRGELVLYADDGRPASSYQLRTWFQAAQKRAGLPVTTGGLHALRHTFCSHLAMRGAPPKAIQELAGHSDLSTTLRYMHLSPAARQGAIELLNDRRPIFGDIVETAAGGAKIQPFSREITG
jgi:integrase